MTDSAICMENLAAQRGIDISDQSLRFAATTSLSGSRTDAMVLRGHVDVWVAHKDWVRHV
ncbi:MAG: hypothetical protein ACI8W7_004862 [Gammaproteobacteria bacterium]|jgi:hypothetical protein